MKDKKGNGLQIGDLLLDDFGDISRIISSYSQNGTIYLVTKPVKKISDFELGKNGNWDIDTCYVVKISEEEAIIYSLSH